MNSLKTDKINQLLRQRKAERMKVEKYRQKRIKSKFYKLKDEQVQNEHQQGQARTEEDRRKIEFYNQVFTQGVDNLQQDGPNDSGLVDSQRQENQGGNHSEKRSKIDKKKQNSNLKQKQNNAKSLNRENPAQNDKQAQQLSRLQHKIGKLKERKKKFIKKMDQRTKKGQPIMNNYVKYALTKLQEGIAREKLQNNLNNNPKKSGDMNHHKKNANKTGNTNFNKNWNKN